MKMVIRKPREKASNETKLATLDLRLPASIQVSQEADKVLWHSHLFNNLQSLL